MVKKKRKRNLAAAPEAFGIASSVAENESAVAVGPTSGAENETAVAAEPTSGGGSGAILSSSHKNVASASWCTSPRSPESPPSTAAVDASVGHMATVTGTSASCGPYANAAVAAVSSLDHILIFGHGKFQRVFLLCTQLAMLCTVAHSVSTASLARPVEHWCGPPPAYANLPPEMWKDASIPL
ncbi:hypothetical protein HPB52_011071 [Rhipicephalus sanguineus]|uniref:Uncharacterized protein n=1 Tax=Rhipicephalus sanguineus TaxID=34632 RepID=A0A9D4QAF6_RHISA|nr:hypothetical protein HPB52_011071 [Rhipicephalus sanguineus]